MSGNLPFTVIDNFLDPTDFKRLKDLIVDNPDFPWFVTTNVTGREEHDGKDYYFTHQFIKEGKNNSTFTQQLQVFFDKLQIKNALRIKGNLYPATEKIIKHGNHTDCEFKNKAAVFHLNTNNGLTIFGDTYEVSSIENRIVLFDGSDIHRSTTCTDQYYRVNLNFNYF